MILLSFKYPYLAYLVDKLIGVHAFISIRVYRQMFRYGVTLSCSVLHKE